MSRNAICYHFKNKSELELKREHAGMQEGMTMKTYIYDTFDTSEDASDRASDKGDVAKKSGLAN
jgi:hypothetical protein